jgi:hypothetical protein
MGLGNPGVIPYNTKVQPLSNESKQSYVIRKPKETILPWESHPEVGERSREDEYHQW